MEDPFMQPKPRILPLPREEWTDEAREVFAFWGEPNAWEEGSKTNSMMVMANHPALTMAHNGFGKQMLMNSTLAARPREIVVLRVAWHTRSLYEWHNHVGYALNAGMSMAEIAATKAGPQDPIWGEQDSAILRSVDELMRDNTISDQTWETLSRYFDTKGMMDLVYTIGAYVLVSWGLNAFGIQLEKYVDPIGFELKTASGNAPGSSERPGESEDWAKKRGYSE